MSTCYSNFCLLSTLRCAQNLPKKSIRNQKIVGQKMMLSRVATLGGLAGLCVVLNVVAVSAQGGWISLPPRNDRCGTGVLVPVNGYMVSGTTNQASTDPVTACGSASVGAYPGVWYWAVGTGHPMKITVNNVSPVACDGVDGTNENGDATSLTGALAETASAERAAPSTAFQISIFTGENCGTLSCAAGTNSSSVRVLDDSALVGGGGGDNGNADNNIVVDGTGGCAIETTTTITLGTELFSLYEILVHGAEDTTGNFGITIEDLAPGAPSNDACEGAHLLRFFHPSFGSTATASVDNAINILNEGNDCGTAAEIDTPGLWFLVSGTGHTMTVRTCGTEVTDFDTKISVFVGSCEGLFCVDSNDNAECDDDVNQGNGESLQSIVTWNTQANTPYFILVNGGVTANNIGEFGIVVDIVQDDPAENDNENQEETQEEEVEACITGTLLPVGGEVTVDGTAPDTPNPNPGSVPPCGTASRSTTHGKWFYALGTGGTMRVKTCNQFDAAGVTVQASQILEDTQVSVFRDTCQTNGYECMDGNDDHDVCGDGSKGSSVSWESDLMAFYDIFVHGTGTNTGNFTISLEDVVSTAGGRPSNDICHASHLVKFGHTTYGSTVSASLDTVPACGSASLGFSPGLWYMIMGTGRTMEASTCGGGLGGDRTFDTQISIFTGSCTYLHCIAGNDDSCGEQSYIQFDTVPNRLYYILVHGDGDVNATDIPAATGNFGLTVDILDQTEDAANDDEDSAILGGPFNDGCSRSLFLPTNGQILGSTVSGTIDSGLVGCGDASATNSPGVWYWVLGTGAPLTVSTCDFATFDTQISVFEGDCDSLVCLDGNNDSCGLQSSVTFDSILFQPYMVLVHGASENAVGIFGVELEDSAENGPSNDECMRAHLLRFSIATFSSTVMATPDTNVTACGTASASSSPGIWYLVLGTGHRMQVSTCDESTNFDTQVSVFSNGCDTLTCVAGNDDYCGVQSSVVWDTSNQELYLIYVQGKSGNSVGEVNIVVDLLDDQSETANSGPPPENDQCIDAFELPIRGLGEVGDGSTNGIVLGSTSTASIDNASRCGTASQSRAPGVWYVVEGNGAILEASTCYLSTLDTQISVYTGSDCNSLVCVDGNDDSCDLQSVVGWQSELNERYYVLVHGYGTRGTGDFGIIILSESPGVPLVSSASAPENDECAQSIELPIVGKDDVLAVVAGSTTGASVDVISSIDSSRCLGTRIGNSPGVWFTVVGTGDTLVSTTCSAITNFVSQVSVFSGSCRTSTRLNCVNGNNFLMDCSANNYMAAVSWQSDSNERYYILVHGEGLDQFGDFEIRVFADDDDFNDIVSQETPQETPQEIPSEPSREEPQSNKDVTELENMIESEMERENATFQRLVIGLVVGAVAIVALAIVAFVMVTRRQKKENEIVLGDEHIDTASDISVDVSGMNMRGHTGDIAEGEPVVDDEGNERTIT